MSKIVIVGGKLQGMEAAYLGKKAGMETVMIDKDPQAPGKHLCSRFICADVLLWDPATIEEMRSADMVLPALENDDVLKGLAEKSNELQFTLAFDWEAYRISSSKILSDNLFHKNDIPSPKYYPAGRAPFIVKPGIGSGSHGVRSFDSVKRLEMFLKNNDRRNMVVQEYVEGPSYSMEVIGMPGNYRTYEITQIFVDKGYDCNLAATLHTISDEQKKAMEEIIVKIAELIKLKGIMDLEVIEHDGELKVLEIDARLPSQTPIVVYHASGMNYVEELRDLFCTGDFQKPVQNTQRFASLEHYTVTAQKISHDGEHVMTEGQPLRYMNGFCGSDEVMSDHQPGSVPWRATFINSGDTREELEHKRYNLIKGLEDIKNRECGNERIHDNSKEAFDRTECV